MEQFINPTWIALAIAAASIVSAVIYFSLRKPAEDTESQLELDNYLNESQTGYEIGRKYERYIGYLYELDGHDVEYHGAVNGYEDMGRDLIIRNQNNVRVIQTKYWAKFKQIHECHIFQLYGSMTHYKLTARTKHDAVEAVFYTTAKYSPTAKDVARVLGVELRTEPFDRNYPMIKCNVSANGDKIFHLPFDPYYDKVKIEPHKGEFYAHTVKEAAAKGFRRARKLSDAA